MSAGAATIGAAARARVEEGERFFGAESERIARACHAMAERFAAGGKLVAIGAGPEARSDARHVSVEFVHPVIVGKRALPAVAITAEGGPLRDQLDSIAEPGDIVMGFGEDEETGGALADAARLGCLTLAFGRAPAEVGWRFAPGGEAALRQELTETLYHVLWELVHVFFDHRGLLEGRSERAVHDPGASSFLYPFLSEGERDLDGVIADVRASVEAKAGEIGELRATTLEANEDVLVAAAEGLRSSFERGGRLLALGNGGSATDAMDVVADFRSDGGGGWTRRRALDLTEDAPILTAVANDVGVAEIFSRQVIAYATAADALIAFSTSGGSENLIAALAEARRRELLTIAMVGYDGGRVAAEDLADHIVVVRSQSIPRIQEAQASAYHVLRDLVG